MVFDKFGKGNKAVWNLNFRRLFYTKERSNFEVFLQIILKIQPLEALTRLKLPIKENISV